MGGCGWALLILAAVLFLGAWGAPLGAAQIFEADSNVSHDAAVGLAGHSELRLDEVVDRTVAVARRLASSSLITRPA